MEGPRKNEKERMDRGRGGGGRWKKNREMTRWGKGGGGQEKERWGGGG